MIRLSTCHRRLAPTADQQTLQEVPVRAVALLERRDALSAIAEDLEQHRAAAQRDGVACVREGEKEPPVRSRQRRFFKPPIRNTVVKTDMSSLSRSQSTCHLPRVPTAHAQRRHVVRVLGVRGDVLQVLDGFFARRDCGRSGRFAYIPSSRPSSQAVPAVRVEPRERRVL